MNAFHKADKEGQKKVKDTIKVLFSGCTLTIDEHIEDSGYIDIYITATTANHHSITYNFNLTFLHSRQHICR